MDPTLCFISHSVALKSEIRKLNIVHLLIWILMALQVMKTELDHSFLLIFSYSWCCRLFPGDSEPAEPGVPQDSSLSVPVGIPVPPEHNSHGLQLPGLASQQHQLPGNLHDQRWPLLRGPADLRRYGNVPCSTAALSTWQSLSLHLWLLCRLGHVLGDRHCSAGAWLADLLQQEAVGPVVHYHTGQEEEMSPGRTLVLCEFESKEDLKRVFCNWESTEAAETKKPDC